ncbi:MAG: hypothetical protein B7X11_05060, partial [Acidobacteria bacterium 37-65-4]
TCVFDLGVIPAGYGWVFPKRDHLNVGPYRFARRPGNRDMKGLLDRCDPPGRPSSAEASGKPRDGARARR